MHLDKGMSPQKDTVVVSDELRFSINYDSIFKGIKMKKILLALGMCLLAATQIAHAESRLQSILDNGR